MPEQNIKHVVFFRFPNKSDALLAEAKKRLLAMQGKIVGLNSVEVGIDFNGSERAWDLVLTTSYASKKDLQNYATDPIHIEVVAWIKKQKAITAVVDYIL